MLKNAEENLTRSIEGDNKLWIYCNDFDAEFESLLSEEGYRPLQKGARPLSRLNIPAEIPEGELPEGFRVLSLADENDLAKINQVLWRGFNHPGQPPRLRA